MYLPPYHPEHKSGKPQDSPLRTSTPQSTGKPFPPLLTDRAIHLNHNTPGWLKPSQLHLNLSATEASMVIGPRFVNRPYARPLSAILERHSTVSLRSTRSTRRPKPSIPGASKENIPPKRSLLRKDSLARLPARLKMSFIQHVKDRPGHPGPITDHISKQNGLNASSTGLTVPVTGRSATTPDHTTIGGLRSSTDRESVDPLALSGTTMPATNSPFSPAQRALHILTGQTARGPFQYKPARYVRLPPRVRAKLVSVEQLREEMTLPPHMLPTTEQVDLLQNPPSPPVPPEQDPCCETGTPSPIIAPSPRRPQKRALSGLPLGSVDTARMKSFSTWSSDPLPDSTEELPKHIFARPGRPPLTTNSIKNTKVSDQGRCSPVQSKNDRSSNHAETGGVTSDVCCTIRDLGSNELSADSSLPDPGHRTVFEPIANKFRASKEAITAKSSSSTPQTTSPVHQLDGAAPPRRPRGGCEKEPKVKQWKLNRPGMIQFGRAVRGARKRLTLAHVGHTGVRNRCWRCAAKGKVRRLKGKLRESKSDSPCGDCS
ncbi:hypothetical protein BDZ85DRAFT_251774 [Elsinoe ampelina]|uniref:Uncharacterized protein n=1 Tax=Elsinoe ampelina TaxID=302913 RepID=A0A6A6G431_9PEZI|nr:hypothetical protein BDZ85DRAFT_251774 [Elsinoe ampelina]